jgi:hypothetical protein
VTSLIGKDSTPVFTIRFFSTLISRELSQTQWRMGQGVHFDFRHYQARYANSKQEMTRGVNGVQKLLYKGLPKLNDLHAGS